MDVLFRVIWWIKLYDPIDLRNIQPSGCDVGTQQNSSVLLAKLEKSDPMAEFTLGQAVADGTLYFPKASF